MYEMFDKWRKRQDYFSDASYYTIHKGGQGTLLDLGDEQNELIFKQMKKYKEAYPNYIYALTMGLGKTILMGTCIFYEFLLAKKYPKDKRFCHNALVFAPDKTVLERPRETTSIAARMIYLMLIMEMLMLFTVIRLQWLNRDPNLISNTLFIKDGPMMLNGQYSKLVPNIREFLNYAKNQGRPINLVASEKSGSFFDYLSLSSRFVKPEPGKIKYAVLNHGYIRRVIQRAPDRGNPYGLRTNWGEKVFVFLDENTHMVLNMTTGGYEKGESYPSSSDIIGLERILATLPALISRKYEGALHPVELVNGIASMSNYPSAKILQDFVKDMI